MSRTKTIAEVERDLSLLQSYLPIIAGAGYDGLRGVTAEDSIMLAGKIMHDSVVNAMRSDDRYRIFNEGGLRAVFYTNWKLLFADLGEDGRAALRERITFRLKKV